MIETSDTADYSVVADGDNVTVLNPGTITSYGICSYGVFANGVDRFSLTNDGVIETHGGEGSYAVYVEYGDNASITNDGVISTHGSTGNGVTVWGAHASIVNRGTITVRGEDATGVYVWSADADSRNLFVNSGTIMATGTRTDGMYGQGIYANAGGMTVINSGLVSSRYEAIYMGKANQTLTLLAGSRIEGGIRFDHADTATLNLGRGLDARLTLTLDGADALDTINADGQTVRFDDNVLTVVSPETNRAGASIAAQTSRAVTGALRSRIDRNRATAPQRFVAPLGYASGPAATDATTIVDDRWAAWSSAYGAASSPDDGGTRTRQAGLLFGFDRHLSDERFAGLFGGLGQGSARLEGGSKVEATTVVAGAYGALRLGVAFVDLTATVGAMFNDTERRILNNMVDGGIETADGEHDGYFFSPSVTLGVDHNLDDVRLTPSVSLLYAGIRQDGYDETGSSANLAVGSATTHVVSARGELEIGTLRSRDLERGWNASVRLGAEGSHVDGSSVDASLVGDALPLAGFSSSELRGFVGADVGVTRGAYDFSLKGEAGIDTAGVFSTNILGGISAKF